MNDVKKIGTDARLVLDQDQVVHVSMAEKLLVLQLSKLSNFIPDGGIWLNTQRPEWNDANNALVGYGVSMVTLYYLNRHISFINKVLKDVNVPGNLETYPFPKKVEINILIFFILISNKLLHMQ